MVKLTSFFNMNSLKKLNLNKNMLTVIIVLVLVVIIILNFNKIMDRISEMMDNFSLEGGNDDVQSDGRNRNDKKKNKNRKKR